ncbi:MAG: helix-turn-helix domain-containing protein [Alphaproteobacteria bacterium]|nr:helix-turn-helix domain-containing protein [Alphaproteobacteria bacterium]
MQNNLYLPQQVSEMLCISVATLRKWRWEGKGPCFVKIGRKVAYRPSDITEYVHGQIRKSTSDLGLNTT